MINGLLGKKVGMTQLLQNDGTVVPVTVIQAGPCVVVQRRSRRTATMPVTRFVEFIKPKRVGKPMTGHFKKRMSLRKITRSCPRRRNTNPGDKVMVDIFTENELVHIVWNAKGRGFAGFVKRHHCGGRELTVRCSTARRLTCSSAYQRAC